MSVVDEQQADEFGTPTDEVITSFVWCDGHICFSHYNISSLDLFISCETVDLRPDFCHLQNIFRIMPNIRNILASGPDDFLRAVMNLHGIPNSNVDPIRYRLHNLKSLSAATFIVYVNNEKTLIENRKRILEMQLPRMNSAMTNEERFNYIESVVPLHQTLIVQCLGNLLHYLDANWTHLFLQQGTRPAISDLQVYKLEGSVLIDDSTFSSLQVFALKDHPSAFKKGAMHAPTTNNGPSVFGVMNTCVSRLGSNQLKAWLFQPIRAITDLKRRHLMIEWCRSEKNAVNLTKFRAALKKVVNAGEVYGRLIRSRGKPSIWKVFKRTLYYTNEIADICIALVKSKAPNIEDTVIEKFGKFASDNTEVYDLLRHIDTIIDLDVSTTTGLFSIRPGLDPNLDAKKEQFHTTRDELQVKIKDEIKHLPPTFTELTCHYVAEMGFLIAIPASGLASPQTLESNHFKFAYQLRDNFYYTSPLCTEMSEKYGHLYVEIREREQEICDRLMEHVYEKLNDIHHVHNFCAQLDCLMAMASFSLAYDLVRPEIVIDRKILEIKDGRHILVELQRKCIPNDTSVSVEKKNLINILIAPNASGKSVYMKTIAQITYLAHVGSYVPASQATISAVDAIYTRMYCPESIFMSKSSYLVELTQMSNVIMNSSSKSLILVDEMGQGTTEIEGKSLLLACLEHLAKRADKSPITFVTTHYTDVYDFMVSVEWVAMKTFDMTRTVQGTFLSTFKTIDGKCATRYARDCALLRRFMKPDATPSTNSATKTSINTDENRNTTSDAVTSVDQESLEEIDNTVRNRKIACAAAVIQAFLRNQENPGEKVSYMDIINSFHVEDSNEGNN